MATKKTKPKDENKWEKIQTATGWKRKLIKEKEEKKSPKKTRKK